MKILDKIGLVLFSSLILLGGLAVLFTISGWLELGIVLDAIEFIITGEVAARVTFVITVLLILLAIKCIFLNDNGKLLVTKDTIESLANAVVKNYETAQNAVTKVELDNESNVSIFITLFVYPDAVIKDLTVSLQKDIKETIKKSLDLEVKDVNVRIKNITPKKEIKE